MAICTKLCIIAGIGIDLRQNRKYKVFIYVLIFLHIICLSSMVYSSIKTTPDDAALMIINQTLNVFLAMGSISTILSTSVLCHKEYQNVRSNLQFFDNNLGVSIKNKPDYVWSLLVCVQLLIFIVAAYVHSYTALNLVLLMISRNIELYIIDAIRMLIIWFIMQVSKRLQLLNNCVETCFSQIIKKNQPGKILRSIEEMELRRRVQNLGKLQNILFDTIDIFCKIFGITMFIDIIISFLFSLIFVMYVIYNINDNYITSEISIQVICIFEFWVSSLKHLFVFKHCYYYSHKNIFIKM